MQLIIEKQTIERVTNEDRVSERQADEGCSWLHAELLKLRKKEQELTHVILEKLQRMEHGRQYLPLGYSSLFDYLVRGLGYSESSAYRRQSCLRLTKEIPEVKQKIESGALTPAGLSMAFKTLKGKSTTEKRKLLSKIENQPSRNIKKILIQETKAPEIQIQKSEYRDKVILRMKISHTLNQKIEKLKALKSHSGNLETLLEKMIDRELKAYELKNNKSFEFNSDEIRTQSLNKNESTNPRYISKKLRNKLLHQAQYKCQQPDCEETHYLQIDHIHSVREGGSPRSENLQVLCGAHNRWKG